MPCFYPRVTTRPIDTTRYDLKAREEMIQRMEDQLKSEGVDVNGVTNVSGTPYLSPLSLASLSLASLSPHGLATASPT